MRRTLRSLLAVSALLASSSAFAGTPAEPLTLRVSDAIGRPGGLTTVVVRTYSPRSVGQGQLDLRTANPGQGARIVGGPIAAIEEVRVFASEGDAIWSVHLVGGTEIDLQIGSPSGTLNEVDGPLFAIQVELATSLVPGETYTMALDPTTAIQDPDGQPIPVDLRPGSLRIVAPDAPFALEADGDDVAPGGVFVSGVNTLEPLALSSATFGLRIDPTFFHSGPLFTADTRYGQAALSVTHPEADLWIVELTSADGSLNQVVTGSLVEVGGIASPLLTPGTEVPIVVDPATTAVSDASGTPLALQLVDGVFVIEADQALFADGFETGDAFAW